MTYVGCEHGKLHECIKCELELDRLEREGEPGPDDRPEDE